MSNHRVPAAGEAVPVDPPNRTRASHSLARWRVCLRWTEFIFLFPNARFEEARPCQQSLAVPF